MSPAALPQELIDRFIEELSFQEDQNLRQSSPDLQSCSLVSRSFYFLCRKLRFRSTTVVVLHNEQESPTLKKLRHVLEVNPTIRREIQEFRIQCADNPQESLRPSDDSITDVESFTMRDIHLPHVLGVLHDLRGFSLHSNGEGILGGGYDMPLEWNYIDDPTKSTFSNLHRTAPFLESLVFHLINNIPTDFITNFDHLKVLSLMKSFVNDDVGQTASGNTIHHTAATRTGLVHRLDELRVACRNLSCLTSMRATGMFWQLRRLVLEMIYYHPYQNNEIYWDMVKDASRTLEHLSIRNGFANHIDGHFQSVTIDDLPRLQTIKISESAVNYHGFKELLRIAHFLTASQQEIKLRNVEIVLFWYLDHGRPQAITEDLFAPEKGWLQLDNACHHSKLSFLHNVSIQITLLYSQPFPEGEVAQGFKQIFEGHSAVEVLPLLSASNSINLDLYGKVLFGNSDLQWTIF